MVGQSGYEAGMFCLLLSQWCRSFGVNKLKTWALWCSLHCVCSCRVKWRVSSPATGISNEKWEVSHQSDNKVGRKNGMGRKIQRCPFNGITKVNRVNLPPRMIKICCCKKTLKQQTSLYGLFKAKVVISLVGCVCV